MGRSPFPAPPPPPSSQPAPGMSGAQPGGLGALPRPGVTPSRGREPAERRTLVVGRGISVQGTVTDAERLIVEGTFEASMIHATELVIALGGVFKGEVEVEDTEIAGTIDGTLTARGNLVVRSTGKVLGTARCRRLQVEDGGQITGRIEMITEPARPEAPRLATEPLPGV
jgi:cytoskeletal protein CcmA (bactofilin family)